MASLALPINGGAVASAGVNRVHRRAEAVGRRPSAPRCCAQTSTVQEQPMARWPQHLEEDEDDFNLQYRPLQGQRVSAHNNPQWHSMQPTLPQEAVPLLTLAGSSERCLSMPPPSQQQHSHMHQRHPPPAGQPWSQQACDRPELQSGTPSVRCSSSGGGRHRVHDSVLTGRISRCTTFNQLWGLWEQHGQQLNHVHVACMMNRLAKCASPAPGATRARQDVSVLLTQLETEVCRCLPRFTSREMANVVWAWASLQHRPSDLTWSQVQHRICQDGGSLLADSCTVAQTLANLAWGLAALQLRDEAVWQALLAAVLTGLTGHQAANTHYHQGQGLQGSCGPQGQGQGQGSDMQQQVHELSPALTAQAGQAASQTAGQEPRQDPGSSSSSSSSRLVTPAAWGPQQVSALPWEPTKAPASRLGLPQPHPPHQQQQQQQHGVAHSPGLKASTGPRRPGAGGWQPRAAHLMVFAPKDLANLAWSFATAGRYDSALFDLLCGQAQASLADFTPRDISNLLWACATCRHPCPALLHTSIPAITTLRHAFTPQALANTLWAHACLGSHSPALFTPLAQQAHRLAPRLLPQHLSQIAWAMATAGQAHCAFLDAAISLAQQPQLPWTTGELARFLWALAVMEAGSADVMLHLASQLLNQLQRRLHGKGRCSSPATEPGPTALQPPAALPGPGLGMDLANAVWALAWSGNYSQPLFQQAAALCSQHPTVLFARPADMASILWPFGFARHYDPPLYCAAAALLAQPPARHGLSLGQQAALLLPLAKLRHPCPSACQQVAAALQTGLVLQPGSVRFSTLCSILWSLMLLGHSDVALLRLAFARVAVLWERQLGLEAAQQLREEEAISRGLMPELNQAKKLEAAPRHIAQLFHVYLWLKDQADPEVLQVADSLPPSLIERAGRAWQREAEKDSVVSQGQYRVLQALQDMGFRPHLESMTSDGLFSIDLCLQLEGRQLAIEYNGPWHYSASSPCRLTGSKLLRNAFLARRGYLVVDIPWWQWEQEEQEQGRAQAYLQRLLDMALAKQPASHP